MNNISTSGGIVKKTNIKFDFFPEGTKIFQNLKTAK